MDAGLDAGQPDGSSGDGSTGDAGELDAGPCDPSACIAPDNAIATCESGACSYRCGEGWGDCDGAADNGCETDLAVTRDHCGTCETTCAWNCVTSVCDDPVLVTMGWRHACAVTTTGSAYCWGDNSNGQLGDGTGTSSRSPVPVAAPADFIGIAAGAAFTCGLRSDGTALCWGFNANGQLGNAPIMLDMELSPVNVVGLDDGVQITAGGAHACVRRSSGAVSCWGWNADGQLGDGTTGDRRSPVAVTTLADAAEVRAGGLHTCARRTSGQVACWGSNGRGQLGDGTMTSRTTPVAVVGTASAVALTLGFLHSCVVTAGGTVSCWGSNAYGELGRGSVTTAAPYGIPTPAPVMDLVGVSSLAGGGHQIAVVTPGHTCAATPSAIFCWGENSKGQFGRSDLPGSATPVMMLMPPSEAIADVHVGGASTCVRTVSRRVLCAGWNMDGQLGNGTTVDSAELTAVVPPAD